MFGQNYRRPGGVWTTVKNLDEVQTIPVPMDGSQMLFMLEDQPVFYSASFDNGRKIIQGFTLAPIVEKAEARPKEPENINDRLTNIETLLKNILGGNSNEPTTKEPAAVVPADTGNVAK